MTSIRMIGIVLATTVSLVAGTSTLAGEVTARGSDSTLGVMKALAEAYQKETKAVVKVEGGGSGKGAQAVAAGEVQLAFLSRHLSDTETKDGLVGVPYAIDGVAIVVHKDNPVDNLALDDLKKILTGVTVNWPDGKPIVIFNRNADSGTRECVQEIVLGKDAKFTDKAAVKHDAMLLPSVAKIPTALSFTSVAEADDTVKVLKINGIAPSAKTLLDKTYPIGRSLTLATKGAPEAAVKAFIDFVLGDKGQAVVKEKKVQPIAAK